MFPPKGKRFPAPLSLHFRPAGFAAPYGELRKSGGEKQAVRGAKVRVHVFPVLSMFFEI
jgi:hypothetical protein